MQQTTRVIGQHQWQLARMRRTFVQALESHSNVNHTSAHECCFTQLSRLVCTRADTYTKLNKYLWVERACKNYLQRSFCKEVSLRAVRTWNPFSSSSVSNCCISSPSNKASSAGSDSTSFSTRCIYTNNVCEYKLQIGIQSTT
jgi:hypothetical protein